MFRRYFELVEQYRFRMLLVLLLVVAGLQSITPDRMYLSTILTVMSGLVFLGALKVTRLSRPVLRVGVVVTVLWTVIAIIRLHTSDGFLQFASVAATMAIVVLVAWGTFMSLFTEAKADGDALAGAVFGYFVLAVLWAALFDAVEIWAPGSFALTETGKQDAQMLYLSLVTITTLGYGDVLPVSMPARMLAGLEAAVGTLYLAILIGRIVGALKPRNGPDG